MSNAATTHNTHRTRLAFAWERTPQVLTLTPTVDDEVAYSGDFVVYGPDGQVVATSAYDFTSDADATAEEIVTGLLSDLNGSDADDYAAFTGTATVIATMSRGYTAAIVPDGAGVLTAAYTGLVSEQGTTPANAAAWALEGALMFVEEASPEYILGDAAVENIDMETRVNRKKRPHKGLPTADGGAITSRLWSSGNTTFATGEQVPQTWLGLLLGHALGGYSRGGDSTVGTVTNQFTLIVDDASYYEVGQMVALEDSNGKLWPAQILDIDTLTLTLDRVQPWTVEVGTKIHGTETCYPEQAALTNPNDVNYKTLSLLYERGPHLWMAGGAHLGLESIALERGGQPKLSWTVQAGQGYPNGVGTPSAPTWGTKTIHSANDVQAIGRGTKLFLQAYGTTTSSHESLYSATFTAGVPVLPQDGITEDDDGMPGRIGYRTEPAETILEHVVPLDAATMTRWTAGTYHVATYYQKAAKGSGWCIHLPRAFMAGPPVPAMEGVNQWTSRLQATERDVNPAATATATEALLAKFCVSLY